VQVLEFNRGHVEYIIATDEALNAAAADGGGGGSRDDDGDDEGGSSKKQKGKKSITKDKEYCPAHHSLCMID
jgi:hypothetical protein